MGYRNRARHRRRLVGCLTRPLPTLPAPATLPKIALAQLEVKPGRPDLNVTRMMAMIDQARAQSVEIIAFPEMCVSGYILGDMWEIDSLVADYASWNEALRAASEGLTLLFGNVVTDPGQIGEDGRLRKYNAALVCHDGEFVHRQDAPSGLPPGIQPKSLHPNYRFFDDDRHFYSLRKLAESQGRSIYDWMVPFEVPTHGGQFRFGIQLCEDIWCQDYAHAEDNLDGVRAFHAQGAEAVFNLSASPWTWQKNDKRNRTVREVLERSPVPFFYVNNVGAQNNGKNIIVFDGDSCAYTAAGEVHARAPGWEEHLTIVDSLTEAPPPAPGDEIGSIFEALKTGLAHLDHIRGAENRFLIGVSGGIDSSVVAALLSTTFGPERVFAVNMPSRFNSDVTRNNAAHLCSELGIDYLVRPIQGLYESLREVLRTGTFPHSDGNYSRLVDENLQARIRGADILAGLAAMHGFIFTNNGNKTEVALGYATLYGDVNGAIAPIADLYKNQVFDLARYMNEHVFQREVIPCNLYDGTIVPSAELSEAQDVTQGLGDPIKYGYHDAVLRAMIEYRRHPTDLMRWFLDGTLLAKLGWEEHAKFRDYFADGAAWLTDLEWLANALRINYFKRIQAPPIIVLSKRAFGFDLRESQLPDYQTRNYEMLGAQVRAARVR